MSQRHRRQVCGRRLPRARHNVVRRLEPRYLGAQPALRSPDVCLVRDRRFAVEVRLDLEPEVLRFVAREIEPDDQRAALESRAASAGLYSYARGAVELRISVPERHLAAFLVPARVNRAILLSLLLLRLDHVGEVGAELDLEVKARSLSIQAEVLHARDDGEHLGDGCVERDVDRSIGYAVDVRQLVVREQPVRCGWAHRDRARALATCAQRETVQHPCVLGEVAFDSFAEDATIGVRDERRAAPVHEVVAGPRAQLHAVCHRWAILRNVAPSPRTARRRVTRLRFGLISR